MRAIGLNLRQNLVFDYAVLQNFDAANKTVDRAVELNPHGIGPWEIKIRLAIAEKGDFSAYDGHRSPGDSDDLKFVLAGIRNQQAGSPRRPLPNQWHPRESAVRKFAQTFRVTSSWISCITSVNGQK